MKVKMWLVVLVFACLGAAQPLKAQQQSQGAAQPAATGATAAAPAGVGPSVDAQGVRNYLLGPGDVVDVRVFGQPDFTSLVPVEDDGNINALPFVEKPIRAQCRTEKDLQREITAAYSKYLKNPQVSVRIIQRNSHSPAVVHGAVSIPQQFQMLRRVRLNE
ncbi:MAG TPA: polysaccharide biosynthesis/export family protein, partial [Pyrinomonadaceae bacterium]